MSASQYRVFIASPLEPEHISRLRSECPAGVEIVHYDYLLPPVRYQGDHNGAAFERTHEQEVLWRQCLAEADILLDFPADMSLAPNVRWVQTTSTGVGQLVNRLGLREADILVTTARGVHGGPLAEFVMLGLLAHFRRLRHLEAEQRAHSWVRYCSDEMAGKTLAIIGAGDLAQASARLARVFGMRTAAVTRNPSKNRSGDNPFDSLHGTGELHEVLGRADAVLVTPPHTPETERMIDAAAFAAMKPGVAFVNIARGQVVDERALEAFLQNGHIGFAALDVAETEPLPAGSPLWDMPNVLISPHSASTVPDENRRIMDIFEWNMRCYVEGRIGEMRNVLDKKLMY